MVSSIIQKSQLEGAKRLDAEYYQVGVLGSFGQVQFKKLGDFVKDGYRVVYENTEILEFDEKEKNSYVGFLQASDIEGIGINLDTIGYVTNSDWIRYKKGRIKRGEILIEVKGKTEKIVLVPDDFPLKILVSGSLYKITVSGIRKEFLLVYLLTKYGQFFKNRSTTNLLVPYINKNDLYNIPVPVLDESSQIKITEVFNLSKNNYKKSINFYKDAEGLLLNELRLDRAIDKKTFVVNLLEIKENNRCDAEYFQPKYGKIVEHIKKNCGGVALGELVTIKKGIEPGAEEYLMPPDAEDLGGGKGKQFIRVSSLSKFGINDNDQKYLSEELYQKLKDDFEPKKGEILLTKDASPGIAYVLKEDIEGIMSGGILRLKIGNPSTSSGYKVEDEYLALCINSVVGQMQVERDAGGSVIAHWRPEQVKNILIPILSKSIQQKISDLIRQSHESRKKAKELLEEAKRKVEELIEKGGTK